MYIKQIIIQGFKSYKEQTVIEPFSPGTNVIVGRNGSGKSNFFAAIRFVLSDAYTQMTREERQALLHEGSGSAVMSAYVEIIFDNSDERFPTGGKEVILRRTIGTKKDEYSVDRKVVTKNDVVNLLEAAGFSRSNPYYIVPQGRVTALTNMKESDRLTLLKEVAGTQVYEARRTESLKIMNETNNKREKIDELLGYIKERLAELEEEKEELRGFQDKDRERRCLEYALYYQEQQQIQEQLERIENIRQSGLDNTDSIRTELKEAEKMLTKLESEIHKLTKESDLLKVERRQLEEDRRETAKAKAKAELKVKTLSDGQSAAVQAQQQHEAELAATIEEISAKKQELNNIIPEYTRRKQQEVEKKQQLDTAEAARNRLFAKQSRGSQFKNKAERDNYLRAEIEDLHSRLMSHKANKMDAEEDVAGTERSIKQLESDVANLRQQLQNSGGARNELLEEASRARETLDKLDDEKKLLCREEEKLDTILQDARQERDRAERELSSMMDSDTARGLATIRRLKHEQDIPGAYGTMAELLEVSDTYRLPVEQIAGNSMFHYIVDNDQTATYLTNHLRTHYGGRLTFMPLNRLHPRHITMPRSQDGIVPLLSKIRYDPMFEKAFQQVFGKVVVCPNLSIGGQYARSHGVDAITLDGDTTNKRGAMTGGYIDPRRSRLEGVQAVNKWRDEYERLLQQSDRIRTQIEQKEQEITRAMGEVQKAEHKLRQLEAGFEPLRHELANKNGQLEHEKRRLNEAIRHREAVERDMKIFTESLAANESELASDFKKSLSNAEEKQLVELDAQVQRLQREWNEASKKRREAESRKQILETDINQNLQLRLDQLNSQAFENNTSSGDSGSLKEAQRELKKLQRETSAIETKMKEIEAKLEELGGKLDRREAKKAEQEEIRNTVAAKEAKQRSTIEKSMSKKAVYTAQAAEAAKAIRDLGVLPEEAFDKYERMDPRQIDSRLKKVRNALKKFQHVNKKAFEQYNSFTSQQDQLLKRRKELDASQASIEELVAHLDQRKDEAIERTFKQVSKEFATIFEKLVPAGHGRLVIQRRTDRRVDPESDEEQNRAVENYTGVGISVSFNSKTLDEQQRIQQLSGGQKSLCALCLIFALQQTESSPMVIFDEVDANLDAQYRTAVASLLESISQDAGTQFICTTFRPEIVHIADKCYGVTFHNKTSSIDCVPTEEALSFVEGVAAGK
ncbi:RecF/RecN/SMC N terminal domain-containing protein [Colletotrichum sublineola]|uniref:Structural maintenance of chromosomes protein n=1 Tax=Colletotrichum sublineola TaxID=1173701 RepID=A0A066WUP4_COLSU|nr:RecF/RecN/SMC N terminal domain-containing protein [Colletotrichum sublineola]KDN60618.1 putative RecF/RecN/SMC N terminal domain-containing protein [Colletotrichum sublineola]